MQGRGSDRHAQPIPHTARYAGEGVSYNENHQPLAQALHRTGAPEFSPRRPEWGQGGDGSHCGGKGESPSIRTVGECDVRLSVTRGRWHKRYAAHTPARDAEGRPDGVRPTELDHHDG